MVASLRSGGYAAPAVPLAPGSSPSSPSGASVESLSPKNLRKAITAALNDLSAKEFGTRLQGLKILGELGPDAAEHHDRVAVLTRDSHTLVKVAAVECLSKFGLKAGSHASEVARLVVENEKIDVLKKSAANCLAKLGERGASEAIIFVAPGQSSEMRKIGARCLAEQGAAAFRHIKELAVCLSDSVEDVRVHAAIALGKIGVGIGPEVLPLLEAETWQTRKAAVQALGNVGPPARQFLSHLNKMLGDDDPGVKVAAMDAFANIGVGDQSLAEKITSLQEAEGLGAENVRQAARNTLTKICKPDHLLTMSDGTNDHTYYAPQASHTASDFSIPAPPDIGDSLPSASRSRPGFDFNAPSRETSPRKVGNPEPRWVPSVSWDSGAAPRPPPEIQTSDETQSIAEESSNEVVSLSLHTSQSLSPTQKKQRQKAVSSAVADLSADEFGMRQRALKTLGDAGDDGAEHHVEVARLMYDKHTLVRVGALECLSKFGLKAGSHAPEVAKLILGNERDDAVKKAAGHCLGKLGERGASQAVKLVAADMPPEIRKIGAKCLSEQGAAAFRHVKELSICLTDKREDVRQYAAEALGKLGSGISSEVLPLLKADEWRTRMAAVQALGHLGPAARQFIQPLAQMLDDEDKGVKVAALEAIGNIGEEAHALGEKVAALQVAEGLGAEEVRAAARKALPQVCRPELMVVTGGEVDLVAPGSAMVWEEKPPGSAGGSSRKACSSEVSPTRLGKPEAEWSPFGVPD